MKVTLTIKTDNAAFTGDRGHEVARILEAAAAKVRDGMLSELDGTALMDANGNKVGTLKVKGK